MDHTAIPLVFFGGIFLIAALVILLPVMILVLIMRASGRRSRGAIGQDELQLVQEIYVGLAAMEKRIEALETILLERKKEG